MKQLEIVFRAARTRSGRRPSPASYAYTLTAQGTTRWAALVLVAFARKAETIEMSG